MKSLKWCFLVMGCVLKTSPEETFKMKKLALHLLAAVCVLLGLSSRSHAEGAIVYGQIETGSINSAGQTVDYSLSGNANDVLFILTEATSGSLCPVMTLYNSGGTVIASVGCSGGQTWWDTITLPSSGTYTLAISDSSNSNIGNYSIYAQRTNNPSGAVNLPFAQVQTGTISSVAQSNTYTFNANANDIFFIMMVATSGSLCPYMQLYGPTGASVGAVGCSGGQSWWDTITASTSGTYTLIVRDQSNSNAGNYSIYAQRTNNPTGAVNLPFAQVQTGTISSVAQSNTYTFNANANDTFFIMMVATSGGLCPYMQLYGPTGASIGAVGCSGSQSWWDTITAPTSGTYTLVVRDQSNTNTGNYDIYAQRTDGPAGSVNLPFAQVQKGSISGADQSKTYTFKANANDTFFIITVATSGSLCPYMQLYGPTGVSVAAVGCSGGQSWWDTITASTSGKYTLIVRDQSNTNAGDYDIYAQRTNNPTGPADLLFGQTQSGSVSSTAQSVTYTFRASAKDQFFVMTVATGGSFCPYMQLYGPTGASLAAVGCSGGQSWWDPIMLPSTGTYTLIVRDQSNTNTGKYVTYVQRTNAPFGYAVFGWGGGTTSGSVTLTAQSNTYAFAGTDGNTIDLKAVATSGSLCPYMQLYAPSGSSVAAAGCSGGTAALNSVALTESGIFILIVRDQSNTNAGNYNISGMCFGACPAMPAITWPTPATICSGTALSATQLDAAASVGGRFVYNPAAGAVLAMGPQNLALTFTPTDTTDYSTAEDSVQLTVTSPCGGIVSPKSLSFTQVIETTSAAKTVTLKNADKVTLTDLSVSETGDFGISANTCGSTLAAGKTCMVSITFAPNALGKVTGTLTFTDSALNSPQTVALSGTGVEPATLTPTKVTYAKQKVGTTSAAKIFTLTNNQTVALTSIVISPSGDFAISATTCATSLVEGEKCTISVTFTPTETGKRTGQLSVSDSAANSPQTASLTGTGD